MLSSILNLPMQQAYILQYCKRLNNATVGSFSHIVDVVELLKKATFWHLSARLKYTVYGLKPY